MAKKAARAVSKVVMAITFYVSPLGKDDWSGRLAAPNADRTDGPFATLVRARDAVRAVKKGDELKEPVKVLLRTGTYFLDDVFVLGSEDSGTAACPVTYAAYPGEAPVISGGRRITGWKVEQVNGRSCWVADVPEAAAGKWQFKELFVNGVRRPRVRLPKEGFYRFADVPRDPKGTEWGRGPDSASFSPGEIKAWKNLGDVEIVALQLWFDAHLHIKAVDEAAHRVDFTCKSIGSLWDEKNQPARYCVENVFEAMERPGEWYLDRPAGRLYYLPLPGEEPEKAEVIAPHLEHVVKFLGNEKGKARHVRMENLAFRHAEWSLPPDLPGAAQAAVSVPGAIIFQDAEDCALYGCSISQIGCYGVEVLKGRCRNRIVACSLYDLGAGGVKIGHEGQGSIVAGEKPLAGEKASSAPTGMRTVVSDCDIHDGGIIFHSAIGVWIGNSGRNRVHHNHIYNFYYTGISCGWTWGYAPTLTMDNRLEYNHIHDIGRGILSDMGGIYMLGTQPGTVIRGNVIHDISKYGYGGWGIYTDEGSSEMLIEDNLTYRTQTPGFFQHYGKDNLVRNNIFALGRENQIGRGREEGHRSFVIRGNVFYWKEGNLFEGSWTNGNYLLEGNLYWRTDGQPFRFNGMPLEDWQRLGQDTGSLIADPLFMDPEAGSFSLRTDSPAFAMHFRPIDASLAGPRFRGARPVSIDELPQEKDAAFRYVQSRLEMAEPLSNEPGAKPGKLRLILKNFGEVASSGSVAIRALPADQVQMGAAKPLDFDLKPGEEKSEDYAVSLQPDAGKITFETVPTGDGLLPTFLAIPLNRQWSIRQVGDLASPGDVAGALAGAKVLTLKRASTTLAELRFALAGRSLAVYARVFDKAIARREPFWNGSSVELFGATPGASEIGQIVFLPPAGSEAGKAMRYLTGQMQPGTAVRWQTAATADGYELSALVPLSELSLGEAAERLLVEVAVSAAPAAGGEFVRATLFGSTTSYNDSSGYGLAIVKGVK